MQKKQSRLKHNYNAVKRKNNPDYGKNRDNSHRGRDNFYGRGRDNRDNYRHRDRDNRHGRDNYNNRDRDHHNRDRNDRNDRNDYHRDRNNYNNRDRDTYNRRDRNNYYNKERDNFSSRDGNNYHDRERGNYQNRDRRQFEDRNDMRKREFKHVSKVEEEQVFNNPEDSLQRFAFQHQNSSSNVRQGYLQRQIGSVERNMNILPFQNNTQLQPCVQIGNPQRQIQIIRNPQQIQGISRVNSGMNREITAMNQRIQMQGLPQQIYGNSEVIKTMIQQQIPQQVLQTTQVPQQRMQTQQILQQAQYQTVTQNHFQNFQGNP